MEINKLKAALYVRVSTTEQANEGYSIQAQTERLKNYAKAKDYFIIKTYTDPGFSGAKLDRPALQEMIKDIENNQIDIVLVYKLDRLSRSQKNTLFLIEDVFLKNNVDFVSMQESFDTTSAFGRAMIGILSVFAQLERDTPMASLPRSPVRMRTHSSMGSTKILPSPMWPVRAPSQMPSIVGSTKSSFTAIARRTFFSRLTS